MKLERLRERLRKDRSQVQDKPKLRERKHPKRLRCSKCRGPREPASLTDRDVVEIIKHHKTIRDPEVAKSVPPEAAFRCRACEIVWLVYPREPKP